jgi:hypothetical protein
LLPFFAFGCVGMAGRTDMVMGHWNHQGTHVPISMAGVATERTGPQGLDLEQRPGHHLAGSSSRLSRAGIELVMSLIGGIAETLEISDKQIPLQKIHSFFTNFRKFLKNHT